MALTPSSVFDTIVINCGCGSGNLTNAWAQVGATVAQNTSGDFHNFGDIFDLNDPSVIEAIRRLKNGSARAYYKDDYSETESLFPVENPPHPFQQFTNDHPFWATDGYRLQDRFAAHGDYKTGDGSRHFEFTGGFQPKPVPVTAETLNLSLSDWIFGRSGQLLTLSLNVPSSQEVVLADIATYGPTLAMRNWLQSKKLAGDDLPASLATTWPGRTFRLDQDPDNSMTDYLDIRRSGFGTTAAQGTSNHIVLVRMTFFIDNGTVDVDALNNLLQTETVGIPGSGETVEPPFGDAQVTTSARKLSVGGTELELTDGLARIKWQDPGDSTPRVMPVSEDYGRTLDYNSLPDRTGGGGKRFPRPEEFPRANVIHFSSTANSNLYFEDLFDFVGYSGIHRDIEIHNRAPIAYLDIKTSDDTTRLRLQPDERCSFRATVSLDGSKELVGLDIPERWQILDGVGGLMTQPYYTITFSGSTARYTPWIAFGNPLVTRNDMDAFSRGSSMLTPGTALSAANFAETAEVIKVEFPGYLRIHMRLEAQIIGSGLLSAGHSATLYRKRGDSIRIVDSDRHQQFTGVNASRTYSVYYETENQAGDIYQIFLHTLHPATTVDIPNSLQVTNYRHEIVLEPDILVTD